MSYPRKLRMAVRDKVNIKTFSTHKGLAECAKKQQPQNIPEVKKENKTLWPLFMDGVQLPQG